MEPTNALVVPRGDRAGPPVGLRDSGVNETRLGQGGVGRPSRFTAIAVGEVNSLFGICVALIT